MDVPVCDPQGVVHRSIAKCAEAHGVSVSTMRKRVTRPGSGFERLPRPPFRPSTGPSVAPRRGIVDLRSGRTYSTIDEAARAFGVSPHTLERWARDPRKAIAFADAPQDTSKVVLDLRTGHQFPSITAAALATRTSPKTIRRPSNPRFLVL